jgi:hypothetical protein
MRCPVVSCPRQTFREHVPGVLERYQRRTARLAGEVSAAVRELAGRAGSRLLAALGIDISRHTALRVLLQIALPALEVPRVLGIDDFALRRGLVYATVLIDAETGRRVDVLEGRTAEVVEGWLREHPGVEVVTRDGSGAYGEAVRSALPDAVQCGDRWHLWHLLAEAAAKEVAAHSACWADGAPLQEGTRAETNRERWQQVHDLRSQGVGLLDCSRRLGLALNTVKRYDKADKPERLRRAAQYRPTLVDPYRDYLRKRRAEEPGSRCGSCCGRSASSATREAPTCSSATSTRDEPMPSGRTSRPARRPRSCSPGQTTSPTGSARRRHGSPRPARR